MQRHHIAAGLTVLSALACAQPSRQPENPDGSATPHIEALAMRRATEKAQATLDDFLVKAKQLPAGTTGYAVRVGIREGGATEYFWVREFSWSDGTFSGRIDDEPRLVKGVKQGEMRTFSRFDVVDWTYTDENRGKTFGHFMACALSGNEALAPSDRNQRRHELDCS